MNTDDLREAYMAFFEKKQCIRRPSDVLVPQADPSVLFTPAGMNQFKEQFLGLGNLEYTRAVTCQKCLRTGDIEEVGKTDYHHTFFEMLGNFSFGDYFKREAIHWAWEFLTTSIDSGGLQLVPDRLSVTVFLEDDEAYNIWKNEIGLPEERIVRDDEKENFWPAGAPSQGPDGVCGPCSEIFYRTDWNEVVEIWNLVFTQFNRLGPPPDNLTPLPRQNIDTGMGLERTAAVMQGVHSNFEIDIFQPLLQSMADIACLDDPADRITNPRIRRICDHLRAITFCIHENIIPANEKQGYVVRRLLRRAVLDGYQLGIRETFLHKLVPVVADTMKRGYPELAETTERVRQTIAIEEDRFIANLDRGIHYFDRHTQQHASITAEQAFRLHATYGFPIELTEALAAEKDIPVDRNGFDTHMKEHATISGSGAFVSELFKGGPLATLKETISGSEFLGYKHHETQAVITGIIANDQLVDSLEAVQETEPVTLVLDKTPFYGESGGQMGDTGYIYIGSDSFEFEVQDTQREDNIVLHIGKLKQGVIHTNDTVLARVQRSRRIAIQRAHSATHLLHHALRTLLGPHAQQAGSRVDEDYLRFDFSHPQAVSTQELEQIETEINTLILQSDSVQWEMLPLEKARDTGAMALFGEKYPDIVRVVSIGDFSRELCGGTHLNSTAEIGLFRIVNEESVAAGTRRITARTGLSAMDLVREQQKRQDTLCSLLKTAPSELPQRVETLVQELRELKKQLKSQITSSADMSVEQLLNEATEVSGTQIIVREVAGWDTSTMRNQIDKLRKTETPVAILFASKSDSQVQMVAGLSRELVELGIHAGNWIRATAQIVGGGGGGKPDMAQAGGTLPDKLDDALQSAIKEMTTFVKSAS
ncbi:MAG: alanine--tRNA ligase [Planctomycetota bacterium]|nr:alanine--tRNA ligase [Planctomycetota bacterium]